jgi:hypothetical protein
MTAWGAPRIDHGAGFSAKGGMPSREKLHWPCIVFSWRCASAGLFIRGGNYEKRLVGQVRGSRWAVCGSIKASLFIIIVGLGGMKKRKFELVIFAFFSLCVFLVLLGIPMLDAFRFR